MGNLSTETFSHGRSKIEKKERDMKPNKQTYQAAISFAQENGFECVLFETTLKDCPVYYATSNELEGTCYGYPNFVFVNSDLSCRFTSLEETHEILSKKK
jgi:hypothetical protein